MNYQNELFCQLIKNSIHHGTRIQPENVADWSYMAQLAKEHNLLAIFINEATKYSEYVLRPSYEKEANEAMTIVAAQVRRTHAFLKLYKAFLEENLHPIVMKGLICRQLYGEMSDHRPSGDEDLLIRPCEYKTIKRVLKQNGYIPEYENETESQLEKLQEISFTNPTERLHIEVHLNIMGRDNDVRSLMSDCFKHVFEHYKEVEINGIMIRTMSHQDHMLYLILHTLKHFIGGGFGMRQMIDVLLYQERYGCEIDTESLCKVLQDFKADKFLNDLIHIGNDYLGFELPVFYKANCAEELLEDIIDGGAFGNKTNAERTAARMTKIKTGNYLNNKKHNLLMVILRMIFPSRAFMMEQFPYLEEKPWLLPVEWVKRWGRFVKRSVGTKENIALESVKISNKRIKLLKKYDLV